MTEHDREDEEREDANGDDDDDTPESSRQQAPRVVPPPPPIKEEKPAAKPRRGRPTGKIGRIPEGVGAPHEADILWLDVLKRIGEEGISTQDMVIRIGRKSPGPYVPLGSIEASTVEGAGENDALPADLLRDAIIDQFHGGSNGPATYDVAFVWKRGATFYDRGQLTLPSIGEINRIRNAAAMRAGAPPPPPLVPAPHPGVGGAPQHAYPQYPQQPYYPPPPGYGQPQQQPQAPQPDNELLSFMREMRQEQIRLSARIEQIAHGQNGAPPPPPIAPQAPPALGLDVLTKVAEFIKPFGMRIVGPGAEGLGTAIPQHAAPLPAPPPPPAPKTRAEVVDLLLAELEDQKSLRKRAAAALGIELPDEDAAAEEPEKDETEEKPTLPFHIHSIPNAHWPDGSPMQHATDAKGNWDLGGLVLSNPYMIDKVVDKFGGTIIGIAQKLVPGAAAAQGVGQPQQQQQQQNLPPPPQRAEPPSSEDEPKADWPNL